MKASCWSMLADHDFEPMKKGEQEVVTWRDYAREYKIDETLRITYELEASTVVHDLARGASTFRKAVRPAPAAQHELDDSGVPVGRSDIWLDLDEEPSPAPDGWVLQVAAAS